MAAIDDADISVDVNGNIRWTGAATTNRHTVLEFIQWLMDKQDDGVAAGDDILDITVDTPFNRSTDQIVTLNPPFNIDDTFAMHLYDGSVSQTEPILGGETLYSGLQIIGPVETGTEYMIIQNGKVLPAFWALTGTGINPEPAPSLVFSRHLVKSKYAGSKIDGQRILVLARELGDQYRRFPVTLGTGNAVAAIGNGADIFNETVDATIAAWTITNTEGFQELNLDGSGAAGQEYYSQWDPGIQSVNDTYEYTKWITQRSHQADVTTGTVTSDSIIDNGTTLGVAQSFIPLSDVTEKLVEVRANIKIGADAGGLTGEIYCELFDSDDGGVGTALPTGAALARSEGVLVSAITTSYEEIIFRFNLKDPSDGSDQSAGLDLGNAEYFIAFRHADGAAGDYFHVEGGGSAVDGTQGSATDTGTWGSASDNDIYIEVKSCPAIHGIPGEMFQGINVECAYDAETGSLADNDFVIWGTHVVYNTLAGGPFFPGEEVVFKNGGNIVSGGTVLYDDGTDDLIVALDTPGAAVIVSGDQIVGLISGATANINVTINDEDKSGGTGILLAIDDNTGTGELYLQVLTGVDPVENNVVRELTDPLNQHVTIAATITTRTINPEFVGTSTGSNIIGTYGIGFNPTEVASPDRFTDLSNTPRPAPNNVSFTVSGLVIGEDRVLVGPRSGSALDRGQWLVATALTGLTETSLVVKTGTDTVPFPNAEENWPDTGTGADVSRLRVERDDGIYQLLPYDSHDGTDTFTLGTPVTGSIDIDVSQFGGTGGQFDRISAGSFLADGFEQGCRFTGANFTSGGNNTAFTADQVYYGGTGTIDMEVSGAGGSGQFDRISAGSFIIDGFRVGMKINTTGFTNGGNNGTFTVASLTATAIVVTDDTGMVNESGGGGNETMEGSTIIVVDDTGMVNEAGSGDETLTGNGWDFTASPGTEGTGPSGWNSDDASVNNDAFMAFIDVLATATSVSFTGVHGGTDRDLFVRVRDGGGTPIKTFESTAAQFLSTPQTVAAIRTSDA